MTILPPWRTNLTARLEGARRIVVVGIGSELRGDDGAGPAIVRALRVHIRGPRKGRLVGIFDGGSAPENHSGEIKRRRPSHIVMVDVARFGGRPGEVTLIAPDDAGGVPFCSHALPVAVLAHYLRHELDVQVVIVGIEPRGVEFGTGMSPEVCQAVAQVVGALAEEGLSKE